MENKAFLHHRTSIGTNIWCYLGVKFWWGTTEWLAANGCTAPTFDEMKRAIEKTVSPSVA